MTRWAYKRQRFTLISIKLWEFGNFLFTRNRVCNHKELVFKLHVCSNGLGKMWASFIFVFSTWILTSHIRKNLILFSHYICRLSSNQFSALNNVKMTCQTHTFPSKLLLGKDMFTLTYVDLEYETSISFWEFEMMIVLQW
jgi:hypothetical protein